MSPRFSPAWAAGEPASGSSRIRTPVFCCATFCSSGVMYRRMSAAPIDDRRMRGSFVSQISL
jgi:hypothetical protein